MARVFYRELDGADLAHCQCKFAWGIAFDACSVARNVRTAQWQHHLRRIRCCPYRRRPPLLCNKIWCAWFLTFLTARTCRKRCLSLHRLTRVCADPNEQAHAFTHAWT